MAFSPSTGINSTSSYYSNGTISNRVSIDNSQIVLSKSDLKEIFDEIQSLKNIVDDVVSENTALKQISEDAIRVIDAYKMIPKISALMIDYKETELELSELIESKITSMTPPIGDFYQLRSDLFMLKRDVDTYEHNLLNLTTKIQMDNNQLFDSLRCQFSEVERHQQGIESDVFILKQSILDLNKDSE